MENSKNIKAARLYRGVTQQQLAELCGLATGTIQQYELNKRNPKIEQVAKIANALNLGYSVFSNGEVAFYDFIDTTSPDRKAQEFNELQLASVHAAESAKNSMSEAVQEMIQDEKSNSLTNNERNMIDKMKRLNDAGQNKAIEQVELLTKIPEYRKDSK